MLVLWLYRSKVFMHDVCQEDSGGLRLSLQLLAPNRLKDRTINVEMFKLPVRTRALLSALRIQ